jgi:hypothetical protein
VTRSMLAYLHQSGVFGMKRAVQGGIESCRLRIVVTLVILALLAFTTIRTSPISAGIGPSSSLSAATSKQRQFTVTDLSWIAPPLLPIVIARADNVEVVPAEFDDLPRRAFFPHCSDLPPPA